MNNNFTIRLETEADYGECENLVRDAFWNVYRPGCLEHFVLHSLRNDTDFFRDLDFVMEQNSQLIGQNIFVRAKIAADDERTIPILTMGPISVLPELQRQGYGKALLDHSLERAAALGFGAVCIEGNIDFYGRSGFKFGSDFGLRYHGLSAGDDASFFLCRELQPHFLDGITGEYATPKGYFVDEKAFTEFDAKFPKKEKLKLAGQLFS